MPSYTYLQTDEGTEILNRLEPALMRKGYTVVERTRLKRILDERDLTLAGIIGNPESIKLLGELTQTQVLLFVDLREMCYRRSYKYKGNNYVCVWLAGVAMGVRAVDVRLGELLWSCSLRRSSEGLLNKPVLITSKQVLSEGPSIESIPGLETVMDVAIDDVVKHLPAPADGNR